MKSGVYQILNTVSGSCYVGSAVNINARWAAHRHSLRTGKKAAPKLQRAWDKYGEGAFEFKILLLCSKENTLLYEQLCIDAIAPKYNTRGEAKSNLGVKWSADTNARKGRPKTTYTVNGVTGSLKTLCRHFKAVSPQGAKARLARGMAVEQAVTSPGMDRRDRGVVSATTRTRESFKGADLEFRGVRGSLRLLVDRFGVVDYYSARARRARGWSLDRVLLEPPVSKEERIVRSTEGRRRNNELRSST